MPYAEIDGQKIHYLDTGGDGPAVVFSHGNLMDAGMWERQIAALPRVRRIAWDARLHGRTSDDGRVPTYWRSAEDLLGLLDHLDLPRAVLVGHSQGGFVSLRAALTAPGRVAGLVLIDTAADPWPPEALEQMTHVRDGMRNAGPEAVAPALLPFLLGDEPDLHEEWLARWRMQPRARLADAVAMLMAVDGVRDRLSEIDAPALVVHGTEDGPVPVAAGIALHAGLPNTIADPVLIPGAAHTPPLTHPDAVTDAVDRMVERVLVSAERNQANA
ncbi:alpha/beta fold hydrolase [Actinomadura rupiterrae]|uniref:alpha/beta fold hydrolase n=1 Tax=Actinomadura rupiterrae TaxID=559627 RepID=UPI0020A3BCD2|nr:alpha/beta hydrolase [Actinomadura rupiterrae]MCP2336552.1 pimeloyl-ACP methyl ester carboxylesterase [Actinomadura rupiterrae]